MSREEVGTCVSAADRAKLNLQVAYGVSSLFYMFLKTQGVSPAGHPVKAELDRIRKYFGRLKQVGKPPEKRTATVDVDASRRFINAALAGDSVWQNARSTGSASAQRKRAEAGIGRSGPAGAPENSNNAHHGGAAGAQGAGTPAAPSATGGASTGEKSLSGVAGGGGGGGGEGGGGSSHTSKRKLDAAADGDDGWVSKPGGRGKGKRRSGGDGGGGSASGGSAAAAEPQWGDRPRAAVPGETPRATKEAKGITTGKRKKKPERYHSW
eukprot:g16659.t1